MLHKLILGTVQFGIPYGINNIHGQPDANTVFEILSLARKKGISLLDTADNYGDAQKIIGDYHSLNSPFEIISKFRLTNDEDIISKIEKSKFILKIARFHTLLYHRLEDYFNFPEQHKKLIELKINSITNLIGVSVYTNEEFNKAIEMDWVDVIQFPYNVLDNFTQKGKFIKQAKEKGKILHARSVFLQGLLINDIINLPENLLPLKKYIDIVIEICRNNCIEKQSLLLNYVLQNQLIDGILFGVDSAAHLEQNIKFAGADIRQEIIQEIDNIKVNESELLYPYNWK